MKFEKKRRAVYLEYYILIYSRGFTSIYSYNEMNKPSKYNAFRAIPNVGN